MEIIYTLTLVTLLILHILVYKTKTKQNILKWFAIGIMLIFCYNILICVILSFIGISSTLLNLSIINLIVISILIYTIRKSKKIQKYFINKMDIIALVLTIIITIVITICYYGFPINIKNHITDAAVHYFSANEFYNNSQLLFKENSDIMNLFDLQFLMPGSYINTGILFKIIAPIVSSTYFSIAFIIFNLFIWFLSGILMYSLLSKNKHKEKDKILPLIFAIIYMLAYPLDSLFSGFSYLTLGLNIIITILIVCQEKTNKNFKNILLFLLNFGIMFSYYYFAPIVYLAIFLQIIHNSLKKKEKLLNINNIVRIVITLIIPGLFGIIYFVVFQMIEYNGLPEEGYIGILGIQGDIYKNLFANICIFLILSLIIIFKKKILNIESKMLILNIIFTGIFFIGMKQNIVSEYYYYKTYYLLWVFVICVAFRFVDYFKNRYKVMTYLFVIAYCICIPLSIILKNNLLFFDIYLYNSVSVRDDLLLIKNNELEVLEYYNNNLNKANMLDKTYMCVAWCYGRNMWIYALTGNFYNYIDTSYGEPTINLQNFIKSDFEYFVLLKDDFSGNYDELPKEITENNLNVLFSNNAGMIISKN